MKGFVGEILVVDLSTGDISSERIGDEIYEKFLSGVGLGAYYLYKNIPENADPMGPDNILGFTSGLLTGTGSLATGRWMAVCKSPITGGWGDANCGGTLSPAIKRCGYDAIFFKGISEKPVYLYADDNGAELRDAAHVWGKDAIEAEEILAEACKTKKKPAIATIGQAGEKLSLISGISNDSGRMAARSGVGAVMGSKRLKAVVLAGSKSIECHDSEKVKAISKEYAEKIRNAKVPSFIKGWLLPIFGKLMSKAKNASLTDGMMSTTMIKKWGTIVNNTLGIPNGDSPIKNWAGSSKDFTRKYYKHLNPDHLIKRQNKTYGCYSCPIRCGGICDIKDIKDGRFSHTHKPEYETCAAFGSLIMNKDLDAVFYINELLNRAGMDCISAGGTIGYAIECFENGILTQEDTGGIELTWGNVDAIIKVVNLMINREGIGDVLADGVKKAAEKIGTGSDQFAVTAGGQEPGMHDSKMDPMLGVHFSAEPTPGRHTIGGVIYYNIYRLWEDVTWAPKVPAKYLKSLDLEISEENSMKAKANSCLKMIVDGSGGCFFGSASGINNWKIFDWLDAATGWGKTPDEYMEIGIRIQTLRQMFNVKHGIDPIQFKMHGRMSGTPPLKEGPLAGITLDIEALMQGYWKAFGWDAKTGVPTDEVKEALQLTAL